MSLSYEKFITVLDERLVRLEERIDTKYTPLNKDVSELKAFRDNLTGKLAVLGFVVTIGVNLLIESVKNYFRKD